MTLAQVPSHVTSMYSGRATGIEWLSTMTTENGWYGTACFSARILAAQIERSCGVSSIIGLPVGEGCVPDPPKTEFLGDGHTTTSRDHHTLDDVGGTAIGRLRSRREQGRW